MAELQQQVVKKTNWFKTGLRYVLVLTVLGALSGLTLSITNQLTEPIIAANEHERLMAMLEKMMPEADEYKLVTMENGADIYFGVKNREVLAAVVLNESKGFNGDAIEILTLVDFVGEVKNVAILKHQETPGIGDKIAGDLFLGQFRGISNFMPSDVEQELEGIIMAEIDIITGATVSSEAVVKGVVQAMDFVAASSIY
ncbi:MAG: FMN-binding protein [Bacillota bacterium]|nr:FMN-binding protein [Bacillota bacterium]